MQRHKLEEGASPLSIMKLVESYDLVTLDLPEMAQPALIRQTGGHVPILELGLRPNRPAFSRKHRDGRIEPHERGSNGRFIHGRRGLADGFQ